MPSVARDPEAPRLGDRLLLMLVLFLGGSAVGMHQGREVLSRRNEVGVVETARSMVASGDWIVPRFQGEIRLHAPPLPYWGTAAAFLIGSTDSPFPGRMVLVGLAVLTLLATAAIGEMLHGVRGGIVSAAILGSSYLFLKEFRNVTPDPYLATFTTCAVAGFACAWRWRGHRGTLALMCAYGSVSLALLANGPIALVWVGAGVLCVRPRAGERRFSWTVHTLGSVLAVAPQLAWAAAAGLTVAGGWAAWVSEVSARLTLESPNGDVFTYVAPLAMMTLPWVPLVLAGLLSLKGSAGSHRWWFLLGFLFLCVLTSRKEAHLLPLAPAAALVGAAFALDADGSPRGWRRLVLSTNQLLVLLGCGALTGITLVRYWYLTRSAAITGGIVLLILAALAASWIRGRSALVPALLLSLVAAFYWWGVLRTHEPQDLRCVHLGRYIADLVPDEDPLVGLGPTEPIVAFYANRTIKSVATADEIPAGGDRPVSILTTRAAMDQVPDAELVVRVVGKPWVLLRR